MTATPFAHLHCHSEYSMLDGASRIEDLISFAKDQNMPGIALTDHGVMYGAIKFYKEARDAGIKPIMGCEVYVAANRHDRSRAPYYHLTLLARTAAGYKNLMKLCTAGYLEGFYRKPRVDMELLRRHGKGIICLSGCLSAEVPTRILEGRVDEARRLLFEYAEIFDAVYLELQDHLEIPEQKRVNEGLIRLHKETGMDLVATNDSHYTARSDARMHDVLLCIGTGKFYSDPKRMRFTGQEFYVKSAEEMARLFPKHPEALENTLKVVDLVEDVGIELGKTRLPNFPKPVGYTADDYLRELAFEGLRRRYGDPPPAEAVERLEMELGVIGRMGFDAYFLIVWDFVKYAKDNGIAVGPGRGSAAGSIVSYSLDITDVDPLRYGLLFERFLTAERVSMPDIDIDFSVKGRDRVIRYVAEKYGQESVAQIITFGRMFPRAATRDAARVLGYDYGAGDRLAKMIPDPIMGRPPSFEDCLRPGEELARAYKEDPQAKRIIDVARGLEGIVRNSSIHAAAVVIADRPLTDIVPLQLAEDRGEVGEDGTRTYRTVTQYSMKPIEEIGLLKMDFLGLRNLDVIESALDIIERSAGQRPDMATLPLDDPKTYEMLARGDSVGVFQFESEGMREALKKVRPTEFDDLVALVALYRPGAMRYIDTYARNKRRPDEIAYIDERLRPITEKSYGVILYQEQSMQIAKEIAGFTGPQADDLRKAIGKKDRAKMAGMKDRFVDGARRTGTSDRVIQELWSVNEAAADYSFNRAHAACYALIAYRTAWLKANHPADYMAALISSVMSTKDKVPFFVSRCEEMGIEVLPPDVNESGHDFKVSGGNIRFGLDAVKNVGAAAVDAIIRARDEGGPFTSIWDFCERVDCRAVNKKAIESLVRCGALDSTGATRTGMLSVLPQAQAAGSKAQQDAQLGQSSIFDLEEPAAAGGGGPALARQHPPVPSVPDERRDLNVMEKETLGLFLSSHPLKEVRPALRARVECSLAELKGKSDGSWVTVGGMIAEAKRIRTKKGDPMLFATLDDLEAQVELLVFNSAYAANSEKIDVDKVVIVRGRVDHKEQGETKLVAQEVEVFDPSHEEVEAARASAVPAGPPPRVTLRVAASIPATFLDDLKEVASHNRGDHELALCVGDRTLVLGDAYRVAPARFRADLGDLQGAVELV